MDKQVIMQIQQIGFGVLFATVIVYLGTFLHITFVLKKRHQAWWESIGSPSSTDPKGQMTLVWRVLFGRHMPDEIKQAIKKRLMLLRLTFGICMVGFCILTYLLFAFQQA